MKVENSSLYNVVVEHKAGNCSRRNESPHGPPNSPDLNRFGRLEDFVHSGYDITKKWLQY